MKTTPILSNPEAEKYLLGTVMGAQEELETVIGELEAHEFYSDRNRLLFETILKLHDEGLKWDLASVSGRLYADNHLDKVGGGYLSEVSEYHAVDIKYQVRLIKDAVLRRQVFEVGNALVKVGRDREDLGTNDALHEAQRIICTLDGGFKRFEQTAPLIEDVTRVLGVLEERPDDMEFLIKFQGKGFLPARTVTALLAAGGTGKTKLLVKLATAGTLGENWAHFDFDRPLKILLICAEEDQDEMDRRLWDSCDGHFSENLYAKSVKGVVGPLMSLDGNTPRPTKWFTWLDSTIANHPGLDLLMLDPKSRFYGLTENDNDHNTRWVACLEALTVKHGIAILFTHHVPKETTSISQWMGRGGQAMSDACRASLGMVGMEEDEGEKYGLTDDWKSYIKVGISKTNYGAKGDGAAWLKFDDKGNLKLANPYGARSHIYKNYLLSLLQEDGRSFSRYELKRSPETEHISEKMKKRHKHFARRNDMDIAIDLLLSEGSLIEEDSHTGRRPKRVLKINDQNEN